MAHTTSLVKAPDSDPPRPGGYEAVVPNPMMDQKGRIWMTEIPSITGALHPEFCANPAMSKYAAYYPINSNLGHEIVLYDPANEKIDLIDYCTNTRFSSPSGTQTTRCT